MPTIFIVDDDPAILDNLSKYLSFAEDLDVVGTALGGPRALAQLSLLQVEVVVSDINMPNMDGVEFLGHIQALDDLGWASF